MADRRKTPEDLRSHRWFGVDNMRAFGHRSRTMEMGFTREDFAGKPVIAIVNTWSDTNTCHSHMRQRAEEVKRGVWQAGGFPVELPAMSVGEQMTKPTSMMYRNFLAMETEELLRSQPVDGVVLMGGCDKTTPGLLMGALSMGLPAIYVPAGPMLRGHFKGATLGSGTDVFKYWAERRAGNLSDDDWFGLEEGIARSAGTCMTMGTASTMTSLAEALGFTLPGASSIPAVDSTHQMMASRSGRRIVEMVWEDLTPDRLATPAAFDNAITVDMALSGSTNAMIHLVAMAGRAGVDLPLERFDEISKKTPVLCNLKPAGIYLMEDFYYAGGLRALLGQVGDLLHLDCLTANGQTLGENIAGAEIYNDDVIRRRDNPLSASGGTAVLRGNLAPDTAVIKPTAAEAHLLKHTGPAVVFSNVDDMYRRIDDPDLPVTKDSVLVLQNAGPKGAPGMPEWGQLPIPKKLLAEGVRDMVRISDCRMSGTSYGACVLHVAPEAAVGGPLALVQDGDMITLDVAARVLRLEVSDAELARRMAAWTPEEEPYTRGYGRLFLDHVTQANKGCDFDFLHAGGPTPEPKIY
ncbi:MAG: dihydroxy-acid dehydratase [Alphaproteobacteria bacterium]|nr:dihydroxy-acid dehydratase [Alphaproteobacteria bacterium]MCB9931204.1 dihydroxy-acid dehydratase [Alphaproteobacteria bacterium]